MCVCRWSSVAMNPRAPWSDARCPAGMVLAVLLYHGHLPCLFQRNLLYGQKNKYRTPRGRPATGLEDARTPAEPGRSREPGRRGLGRSKLGSS